MAKIQSIRGMNDILPIEESLWCSDSWRFVESLWQEIVSSYGYKEIRTPILESTNLFSRSIGEVTDIVEKEMYTFADRNDDSLTLRPEGTAGCVRAGIESGLIYNQIKRLWYFGPMFRHERPQRGRFRQFWQFGIEAFGMSHPSIEAELIQLSFNFFKRLGLDNNLVLKINTIGSLENRNSYQSALVDYLTPYIDELDIDSQKRLQRQSLRILDSKDEKTKAVLVDAPKLQDYLDDAALMHYENFKSILAELDIPYEEDPMLVRGLDYYSDVVFEWVTKDIGAQNTVCAGGRYDALVSTLGGSATPAVGFAMGMERLLDLLITHDKLVSVDGGQDIFVMSQSPTALAQAMKIAEQARKALPSLRVWVHCGGGSMKNQFKKADKSKARLALIVGQDEIANQSVSIKFLREDIPQQTVAISSFSKWLVDFFT